MLYRRNLAMFGNDEPCHHEHCRFHPSGDPAPSPQDIHLTQEAGKAGALLGVEVLDHIVLGKDGHVSLREGGFYTPGGGQAA
jgi:hypothetical protein